jgi:hypothetical protein
VADEVVLPLVRRALELERPRSDHAALHPPVRLDRAREDDALVARLRDEVREGARGLLEPELDRVAALLDHALGAEDALEDRERLRLLVPGVELVVGDDVVRRHLGAVVEADAAAELERPDPRRPVRPPARGEPGADPVLVVGVGQVLARDPGHAERARLGELVRLERAAPLREADARRAADPDGAGRGGGRDGRCGSCIADVRERARHDADREAEHRAAAQELGAVELAGDQLVDQVVLDRSRLVAAELLEQPPCLTIHAAPFSPVDVSMGAA